MHAHLANYQGNPNIGLFCYVNDRYCLVPFGLSQKEKFEKIFKVPIYELRAAGTNLLGVFFAGNNDILLVPEIMFDSELKLLKEYGIKFKVINSELTALGNNLLIQNNVCISNPDNNSAVLDQLLEIGFVVKSGTISELNIVGSLAKGNSNGIVISPEVKEYELKFLKDNLKTKLVTGTVNFGSPYISSGLICNSNGFIIGDTSGGPEVQNVDEALGFLNR